MEGGYRLEVINGELQNVSNVLEPRSTTTSSSSSSSGLLLCDSHTSISMREKHTNRIILDDHRVRHDCPNSTMTFLQRQNYDLRNADAVSNRSEGSEEEASPSSVNVVTKPFLSNLNSLRHALSILNNHSTDLKQAMNVTSAGPPTQRPPPPPATRIACRARGMPDDHSFQSAYLVIPQDVQHGQELICSYPACRESGVKFCFCKHCHIPVAKHNFRSRHHHVKDEETTATKSSPATTICVDCNPQTVVMNESSSSLVSSTSASTNNNSTPAAFNLGTAVQQQFLGAATAGALMMNPPGVPPNLELFYSSLLLEDYVTTIRKQQTILPDNVSNSNLSSNNTRINNPASAAGRLLAQDFFAPLPKGELVAGPHNRFPSNIISLAAGSNNNNIISSSYYNIEKQQRPAGASTPQVKSQWSPSVPDSHRTWPCQARGSDEEHKRTAHFVIPHDIKHGAELVCSDPICQGKGVKFCFCTICNIPAAKPCFRRRHNHCDFAPPASASATSSSTTMNAAARNNNNLEEEEGRLCKQNATLLDGAVISNLSAHSNSRTTSSATRKRKHANEEAPAGASTVNEDTFLLLSSQHSSSRAKVWPGPRP